MYYEDSIIDDPNLINYLKTKWFEVNNMTNIIEVNRIKAKDIKLNWESILISSSTCLTILCDYHSEINTFYYQKDKYYID